MSDQGEQTPDLIAAAESRGEARGRVQGLREAAMALSVRTSLHLSEAVSIVKWLSERADAIEQGQLK